MAEVIEFLCPNGHRIHCGAEQVGRAAKCPRCGVKFRVPDPAELESSEQVGEDSAVSPPELSGSAVAAPKPGAEAGAAGGEPQIEFLCPNGHRLHGPASLQGRPGECPECGARFRIPSYEEISLEEEPEQLSVASADDDHPIEVAPEGVEEIEQIPIEGPLRAGPRPAAARHPLAELFSRLWAERPRGGSVELKLDDGETLVPERFSKSLSGKDHGVFGVQESDGTHTLTVVAWDSIRRILVRGLKRLPGEMSD